MVYFVTDGSNIKIGYTEQSIEKRVKQLQTGNKNKIYSLGWMEGNKEKEQELHMIFSKERVRINGEWFLPSAKLLDYINLHNLRSNTYVDFINNKLMPLLMIHSISI